MFREHLANKFYNVTLNDTIDRSSMATTFKKIMQFNIDGGIVI